MGYSPVSTIYTPPTPATSGTALSVQPDCGDRFPEAPFTYLAWPVATIPKLGTDSEEGIVLTVSGDDFTLTRPSNAVALTAGMQIAALATVDVYSIEEHVTLAQEFPATDTNVSLQLRTPGGVVSRNAALAEAVGAAGGSAYSYTFEAGTSGLWAYGFTSDQRVFEEDDFFVRYTGVS